MGTQDSNTPIMEVPVEDGSIACAIDELDGMISSWASAMNAAQRAVARVASLEHKSEAAAPATTGDVPRNQATNDARTAEKSGVIKLPRKPGAAPPDGGKQVRVDGDPSDGGPTDAVPTAVDAAIVAANDDAANDVAANDADVKADEAKTPGVETADIGTADIEADDVEADVLEATLVVEPVVPAPVAPVRDLKAERMAALEEDEALLATVDPKVAKALKIKRRLSNGKKSIRQLLEEG